MWSSYLFLFTLTQHSHFIFRDFSAENKDSIFNIFPFVVHGIDTSTWVICFVPLFSSKTCLWLAPQYNVSVSDCPIGWFIVAIFWFPITKYFSSCCCIRKVPSAAGKSASAAGRRRLLVLAPGRRGLTLLPLSSPETSRSGLQLLCLGSHQGEGPWQL